MFKIGFTGTREGLRVDQITQIIQVIRSHAEHGFWALHGDCVGADTQFHRLLVSFREDHPGVNIAIAIYPPDNDRLRGFNMPELAGDILHKPAEYLKRNKAIVQAADLLIACPRGAPEKRSGTWYTIRQAQRSGVPVVIFFCVASWAKN